MAEGRRLYCDALWLVPCQCALASALHVVACCNAGRQPALRAPTLRSPLPCASWWPMIGSCCARRLRLPRSAGTLAGHCRRWMACRLQVGPAGWGWLGGSNSQQAGVVPLPVRTCHVHLLIPTSVLQ